MLTTFSQSPLWQLQRQYFEETHIDAWRQGDVPHYVTSNPHMAETYARLLLAFFRDRQKIHPSQAPIYIVELGTGSGRFSYHLLKAFTRLLETTEANVAPFVYVMTDFVEETLEFWEGHLRLQPFFAQGILDYALFDAEKDATLRLKKSGKIIDAQSTTQPIVAIANYFFDSIPQDLFYFQGGTAQVPLVQLEGYAPASEQSAREQLEALEVSYQYETLTDTPYQHLLQKQLFRDYQHYLTDSHLLFPSIGIQCIDRLKDLSQEGLLLITADKAIHRIENWHYRSAPYIAKHGSFSLTANYHALKEHCRLSQGKTLFPTHPVASITIGTLLYLKKPQQHHEVITSYQQHVNDFGPDDYFSIKKHIEQQIPQLSTHDLLAYLRLSGYDARLFHQFLPRLHELVEEFTEDERFTVLQMAGRIWDGHYPLGETVDMAFEIGTLLLNLAFFQEALNFFHLSEKIYGKKTTVTFAKAAAYALNNHPQKAIDLLNELLHKDPLHRPAQELLHELTQTS